MVDKYYTPSIEEFHVGFEYEIAANERDWVVKIFNIDHLKSFLYEQLKDTIAQQYIRVKYLDKADIESLGFELKAQDGDYHFILERDDFNSSKLIVEYSIWYVGSNNFSEEEYRNIRIYRTEGIPIFGPDGYKGVSGMLFKGNIKNKSELKVLLKQLGIDGS